MWMLAVPLVEAGTDIDLSPPPAAVGAAPQASRLAAWSSDDDGSSSGGDDVAAAPAARAAFAAAPAPAGARDDVPRALQPLPSDGSSSDEDEAAVEALCAKYGVRAK
jgi:hypothetical protein